MKHFYIFLFTTFFSLSALAQNAPFITTWEVTPGSLDITIPTTGTGYNYTVDFGDGTVQSNVTGDATHTYNAPGIYTVSISGDFPRIYFRKFTNINTAMLLKIKSVDQWGDIQWQSMESAFYGCSSLEVNATDAPDLSLVTDMSYMFLDAEAFNQSINHWNVSNVTKMSGMFWDATNFNQPLDNWNVSNVINMSWMFTNAISFNQPLNTWNVSNVVNMHMMFYKAQSFNQPLNNWDVSNVIEMDWMFTDAIVFNQPLNNWDVSNVVNIDYMFQNAQSFNQDLSNWQLININWNNNNYGMSSFLSNSGMDIHNYDKFLNHLATLDIQSGALGAHNLEYCNTSARDYLMNQFKLLILGDSLSQDCNLISGTIMFDQNNNGCDPNDLQVDGFMIAAHDGTTNWTTYSSNGTYNLDVAGTNFNVSVANYPNYLTVTPASVPVTFTSSTATVDFCVTSTQSIEDLNITLIPIHSARPGFGADYRLVIRNVGTETIPNVDATLQFDDSMQQFVSANPAPTTTTTNTLTFSVGTLQPFQKFEVEITMLTFQPPTVNGGDILNFTADVTPVTNDFTPTDNTYTLAQVVVNSYDPNDKQVLQGEELHIDKTDDYLDYLIRFQNTGTASAINVRILDTLHPKLDWNTFVPISASHDYYIKIKDGNHVEFMFDNIHLPDSISNEPESHGYVAYKIRPKSDVQVGDVITGDAAIYFDFNPPIITNTVETLIVESLDVDDFTASAPRILIYPNPADDVLNIHTSGVLIKELILYDIQGRKIQQFEGNRDSIDVSHLNSGIYFIKINTDKGSFTKRVSRK